MSDLHGIPRLRAALNAAKQDFGEILAAVDEVEATLAFVRDEAIRLRRAARGAAPVPVEIGEDLRLIEAAAHRSLGEETGL